MTEAEAILAPIPEQTNEQDIPNTEVLTQHPGYNLTQENGQRKYGPPTDWDGPPPAKGSEVFVGKLPRDVFEDELLPLFERIGKIYEMRIMMDFEGNNRGYAFVMLSSPEEAKRAIKEVDNFEIRKGRLIGVCKSVDNCRLFVGGIPKTKTKEDILEEMKRVTEAVFDVILYSSIADKTKNRGFAFIEYESHKAAAVARRKLMPGKIQLFGHDVAVDWAEPELEVDEDTMAKVTVLYVRNLMPNTTEDTIRDTFCSENNYKIDKVKKLRDFAFVHYRCREDAEAALDQLSGSQLEGSTIEVTWAKPVDKAFKPRCRSLPPTPMPAYNHYLVGYDQFSGHIPFPPPIQVRPPMLQRFPFARRGRGAAGIRRFRNYSANNRSGTYKHVEMPVATIPPPYTPYQSTKLSRIPEEGKAYHGGPDYIYVPPPSSADDASIPPAAGPTIAPYPGHTRIAHHGYMPVPGYEEGGYFAFVPAHPGIVQMY